MIFSTISLGLKTYFWLCISSHAQCKPQQICTSWEYVFNTLDMISTEWWMIKTLLSWVCNKSEVYAKNRGGSDTVAIAVLSSVHTHVPCPQSWPSQHSTSERSAIIHAPPYLVARTHSPFPTYISYPEFVLNISTNSYRCKTHYFKFRIGHCY